MCAGGTFDVLIVGSGPAGACCGIAAARAGLRTALIERRPADGPRPAHVVSVERPVFIGAGIDLPAGEEVALRIDGYRVYSPSGRPAFDLPDGTVYELRLDRLLQRLAEQAARAGVQLFWEREAIAPLWEACRCQGVVTRRPTGELEELRGRVVVDATGHAAALVRRLPAESGIDFTDRPGDRVWAENRLYRIDPAAALEAVRRLGLPAEMMLIRLGVEGGYSTEVELISPRQGLAYVLVGVKADFAQATLAERIAAWERRVGCCRELLQSGAGAIRIRRASLRLVTDGFAVLGEAAGMVIPMHGSGVASALHAGQALGRHLGQVLGPGRGELAGTTADLWPWAADYQRGRGAILASYDANRRTAEQLDPHAELEPMVLTGLIQPEDMVATLLSRPLRIHPATLPTRLAGTLRHPLVGLRLLAAAPHQLQVEAHWRRYPRHWDPAAHARWCRKALRLLP